MNLCANSNLPAKLVISHASGDEGTDYEQRVREYAHLLDVTVRFESDQVQDERGVDKRWTKRFTRLAMCIRMPTWLRIHPALKVLAMPILEAVYYRRPILVNNYSIYEVDIKPKGFRALWFDGFISTEHA